MTPNDLHERLSGAFNSKGVFVKRFLATSSACLLALTLAGCGGSGDSGSQAPAPAEAPTPTGAGSAATSAATSGQTYTMADVQKHNSSDSCWTAINNEVYDVTSWISQHPGGPDKIEGLCGKDGTSAFEGQHSGDSNPQSRLASFKIGALSG